MLRNFHPLVAADANWAKPPEALGEIRDRVAPVLKELLDTKKESLDALCHGDLQTGNFVLDEKDHPHVVDLDTMAVGTIYSDGLMGLIWRGADASILAKYCDELRSEEKRAVSSYDISYAIGSGISWFSAIRTLNAESTIPDQVTRLCKGLSEAIEFRSSIG